MDWLSATRTFCQVVDVGSFTEAAKIAEVSPSAVSKRIEWLEKNLGVSLLVRTTRKIHLTEAGETFLPKAQHLIGGFDAVISETQFGAENPTGLLRIAAPLSVGSAILMPHIQAFLDQYPNIKIQLDVQSFGANPDLDHDLVICRLKEDFDSSAHRGVKLSTYQMGIYASPQYLAKHSPINSIEELEKHKAIIANFQRKLGSIEMENGIEISVKNHNFISENLDSLLYAAVSGMGVIYTTPNYIKPQLATKQLVQVLPNIISTEKQLWAFYPNSEFTPLKTRLFLDYIKARI